MKLTRQEEKIVQYLTNKEQAYIEELAQFCQNPQSVKLRTVQKIISNIKKKFKQDNLPLPFNCKFTTLTARQPTMLKTDSSINFNGQTLVKIQRVSNPCNIITNLASKPENQASNKVFVENKTTVENKSIDSISLRKYDRRVSTRSGLYTLNDEEFELFEYIHNNSNRFIPLEELRDKVSYPKYGSKLPARWFSAIQRRISNIRHQVPETRNRLLTVKQQNSSGYIFS